MTTVQIDKAITLKEYNNGGKQVQDALKIVLGERFFITISDDSYEKYKKACTELALNPEEELPWKGIDLNEEQLVDNAFKMLRIIARQWRKGWVPDYANSNQKKWWAWLEYKPGVGFVVYDSRYDLTYARTLCGSRLCMETSDLAKDFANENIELIRIVN